MHFLSVPDSWIKKTLRNAISRFFLIICVFYHDKNPTRTLYCSGPLKQSCISIAEQYSSIPRTKAERWPALAEPTPLWRRRPLSLTHSFARNHQVMNPSVFGRTEAHMTHGKEREAWRDPKSSRDWRQQSWVMLWINSTIKVTCSWSATKKSVWKKPWTEFCSFCVFFSNHWEILQVVWCDPELLPHQPVRCTLLFVLHVDRHGGSHGQTVSRLQYCQSPKHLCNPTPYNICPCILHPHGDWHSRRCCATQMLLGWRGGVLLYVREKGAATISQKQLSLLCLIISWSPLPYASTWCLWEGNYLFIYLSLLSSRQGEHFFSSKLAVYWIQLWVLIIYLENVLWGFSSGSLFPRCHGNQHWGGTWQDGSWGDTLFVLQMQPSVPKKSLRYRGVSEASQETNLICSVNKEKNSRSRLVWNHAKVCHWDWFGSESFQPHQKVLTCCPLLWKMKAHCCWQWYKRQQLL